MFFFATKASEDSSKVKSTSSSSSAISDRQMATEDPLCDSFPGKVSGLRRNGTLKGRNMMKKVPCPIVPTGQSLVSLVGGDKMGPNGATTSSSSCPRVSYRLSTISSTSSSSSDTAACEAIESWLASIHFEEYTNNFILNGYDLATASRMSPEDLIAIGITNPVHRKKIKMQINALNVPDGIPTTASNLYDWLYKLRLEEYYDLLCHQSYDSIEKVASLTWEDFEEIGIQKLGHQKRLDLAIKKMNQEQRKNQVPAPTTSGGGAFLVSQCHYASTSTINCYSGTSASTSVSFPDLTRCPTNDSFRPVVLVSSSSSSSSTCSPSSVQNSAAPLSSHGCGGQDGSSLSSLERNSSSQHRFKQRPVAMIQAKTRPASTGPPPLGAFYPEYGSLCHEKDLDSISNCTEVSSVSSMSSVSSSRHNYAPMSDVASIYATLKRSKKPPPPPKRTNSVSSNSAPICLPNQQQQQHHQQQLQHHQQQQKQQQQFVNHWPSPKSILPQAAIGNNLLHLQQQQQFLPSNHCKSFLDAVQEAAFATCVKSLASQFSQISKGHEEDKLFTPRDAKVSIISSDTKFGGSDEFPPPPTPLRQSTEDICSNSTASENQCSSSSVKSPISSSSSNESLPFANDNLGTIRQSASSHSHALMTQQAYSNTGSKVGQNNCHSNGTSTTTTTKNSHQYNNHSQQSSQLSHHHQQQHSSSNVTRQSSVQSTSTNSNVMDDIETMLANLSNQLDAMLEQEVKKN